MRDLLRLDRATNLSAAFIRDPIDGFDNAGELLDVSAELRGDYERAAETLAEQTAGDSARLGRLLPANAPTDLMGRGQALVRELGKRAYRRPLDDTETRELVELFRQGPQASTLADPFAAGASLVIRALLQSPSFLYRTELGTQVTGGRIALDDWEVAARLAFALTNTMPDDQLFTAAERGALRTRAGVETEARRLLSSPAAMGVVDSFNLQVLQVPKYAGIGPKDKTLFPQWEAIKDRIAKDAEKETLLFGREVFQKDLGLRDLLTAPFSFVNARLASLYGLAGSFPAEDHVRAPLDPTQRAGVLTQIGFLAARAGSTQPDPIHRGLFVIKSFICESVPPPLPNVTAPQVQPGRTNRQIWETQTHVGACKGCHGELINPVGFAFEGLDATGRTRKEDSGLPVDASGFFRFRTSGEKRFNGAVELAKVLAEAPEVHACFARHFFTYVHGRTPQPGDDAEIGRLARRLGPERAPLRALLLDLVTSEAFLTRAAETGARP